MYYNESRLGLVCARLRGEYDVTRDDRVDLEFKNLVMKIGPFQAAEKVQLHHRLAYAYDIPTTKQVKSYIRLTR